MLRVLMATKKPLAAVGDQPLSGGDLAMANLKAKEPLLRIEVEAGKTYYIEWSVGGIKASEAGGKMKLVDEATGAKKVGGLRLTEHR